jgi:hypothetical protein
MLATDMGRGGHELPTIMTIQTRSRIRTVAHRGLAHGGSVFILRSSING